MHRAFRHLGQLAHFRKQKFFSHAIIGQASRHRLLTPSLKLNEVAGHKIKLLIPDHNRAEVKDVGHEPLLLRVLLTLPQEPVDELPNALEDRVDLVRSEHTRLGPRCCQLRNRAGQLVEAHLCLEGSHL